MIIPESTCSLLWCVYVRIRSYMPIFIFIFTWAYQRSDSFSNVFPYDFDSTMIFSQEKILLNILSRKKNIFFSFCFQSSSNYFYISMIYIDKFNLVLIWKRWKSFIRLILFLFFCFLLYWPSQIFFSNFVSIYNFR